MHQLYCEKCGSKFLPPLEACLFCPHGEKEEQMTFLCKFPDRRKVYLTTDNSQLVVVKKVFKKKSERSTYGIDEVEVDRLLYKKKPRVVKKFYNALLTALTGGWDKALARYKLAGKLNKRLALGKKIGFQKLALILTRHFPYAEKDAKSCPSILRAKILAKACRNRIPFSLDWLGGIKFIYKSFPRPRDCNWTPRTRNDMRVAEILYRVEIAFGRDHIGRELALRLAKVRNQIKMLPRGSVNNFMDGVRMYTWLRDERVNNVPAFRPEDIKGWHDRLVVLYNEEFDKKRSESEKTKLEAYLPGENLIPELEHERVKQGKDLVSAGRELHHCVGSYYDSPSYVHYRRGTVVCQVHIDFREYGLTEYRVTQCYDSCNRTTEASESYRKEVASLLPK